MPLALIFEEEDLPHSPRGFLPILREIDNQRLTTSSFLYFSLRSLTSSRKDLIRSPSTISSSSESFEYSLRRASLTLLDNSGSTCQRCLNSSSSFSRLNSSPTTKRKWKWFWIFTSLPRYPKRSFSETSPPRLRTSSFSSVKTGSLSLYAFDFRIAASE